MQTRLKELRTSLGLSQARFAQEIHKSPGYISNAETGRGSISEYTMEVICERFSVNRVWLETGEGEMFISDVSLAKNEEQVGKRVKELRKSLKMTRKEFAKEVRYSVDQIYAVESGKVIPSQEFLHKVAGAFAVSEPWLIDGTGEMNAHSIDEKLIRFLEVHPDIVKELIEKYGLR